MANKYIVTVQSCNLGNKGDIVELDTDELTERQQVMLKPYEEPKAKKLVTAKK